MITPVDSPLSPRPRPPLARNAVGPLWRSGLFWRMMGGAIIAFMTLVSTVLLAFWITSALIDANERMRDNVTTADQVSRFAFNLNGAYSVLNLLFLPNYQPAFYTTQQNQTILVDRAALNAVAADPYVRQALRDRLAQLLTRFDALNQRLIALNDLAGHDQAQALAQWIRSPTNYAEQLGQLSTEAQTLAQDLHVEAQTQVQAMQSIQFSSRIALLLLSAAGLCLGLVFTILVFRHTVQRITALQTDLGRLAAGDLRLYRAWSGKGLAEQGAFPDEVTALEASYVQSIRKLRVPLQRLQADALRITTAATEIRRGATDQASGAHEQAAAITEVTTTAEELSQTAVQIATTAGDVARAAEQALASVAQGQAAVQDSIAGMTTIKTRVSDITTRILDLTQRNQRIDEVIDLIQEIAGQTHLLALNAAIESASAGIYGQRFAVVAAEVKALAQRSQVATTTVRSLIAEIQTATAAAVMATEEGLKETERGVGLAHQSGVANEHITHLVERTAQLAAAISAGTQQQRSATEQMVFTLREVAQVAHQTLASSDQARQAADDLGAIAAELQHSAAGFQVPTIDEPAAPPSTTASPYPEPQFTLSESAG